MNAVAGARTTCTDRGLAIERRVKDDRTAIVYFHFRPDVRYRGLSHHFGSGIGCGLPERRGAPLAACGRR